MTKSVRKSTAKLSFAMTDRTTTISGLFRVAEKGAKRLQSRVCIIKGAIPEGETEGERQTGRGREGGREVGGAGERPTEY